MLCGTEPTGPGPGLALVWLRLEPALRCAGPSACSPCLQARLRLAMEPGAPRDGDGDGDMSLSTAASPPHNVTGLLLLSGHTYASSRCVAVEVWAPLASALPGRRLVRRVQGQAAPGTAVRGDVGTGAVASPQHGGFPAQGSVRFRCFEAPLGSELHVTAYTNARGRRWLSQKQRVPGEPRPSRGVPVPPQCLLTPLSPQTARGPPPRPPSRSAKVGAGVSVPGAGAEGGVPNTPHPAVPSVPCHPRGCCGEVSGCPARGALSLLRAVPRLQVSLGPEAVLVEVQAAAVGLNYTLRLYHNHSHGAGGSGRTVMAVSASPFLTPRAPTAASPSPGSSNHPAAGSFAVG